MSQQSKTGPAPAPDLSKIADLLNEVLNSTTNVIARADWLLLHGAMIELRAATGAAA